MTRAGYARPIRASRSPDLMPADLAAPGCLALSAIPQAEAINPRGFREALSLMLKARHPAPLEKALRHEAGAVQARL